MKTLPAVAFIAALVAFVILPVNFEITGALLFGTGLAAILVADYTRPAQSLRLAACAVRVARRTERFSLAA